MTYSLFFRFGPLRTFFRVTDRLPERETTSPTVMTSYTNSYSSNLSVENFSGMGSNMNLFPLLLPTEEEFLTYPENFLAGRIGKVFSDIMITIAPDHCGINSFWNRFCPPSSIFRRESLSTSSSRGIPVWTLATAKARKMGSLRVPGWSSITCCNLLDIFPQMNNNFIKERAVCNRTLVWISQNDSVLVISEIVERLRQRNVRLGTFKFVPNLNCSDMW